MMRGFGGVVTAEQRCSEIPIIFFTTSNLELLACDKKRASGGEAA